MEASLIPGLPDRAGALHSWRVFSETCASAHQADSFLACAAQHGISVALSGPAVFSYTAPSDPERHRQAAQIFEDLAAPHNKDHLDTSRVPDADIGPLLHDRIARFLVGLDVPRGLKAIGYKSGDVDELVKGTLPQRRVLDLARAFLSRIHSAETESEADV